MENQNSSVMSEGKTNRSEVPFRILFEQNPAIMLIYELSSLAILSVNEAFLNHYRYSEDEILSMNLTELYPENEKEPITELIKKISGLTHVGEWHHFKKDGTLITIEVSSHGFTFENRAARIAVINDITERKQNEIALQESEVKYRRIVDTANEGIWTLDTDSRTTVVNARMLEILGINDKEMVRGRLVTDFMFEEDLPDHYVKMETCRKGISEVYERRYRQYDGQTVWTLVSSSCIFDSQNQFIGTIGMITDITERKLLEETLKNNESQLSAIFNTISDILYFISVEPNDIYRFISINEMFLKTTGLKKQDIVNKTVTEVLPPSAHELVLGKYREAIRTKQTVSWEEISEYPNGKKYGLVKVTPIYNEQGDCINLVGSVHDITTIKESEIEIRQLNAVLEKRVMERTVQLESINKELEAFSYSVSHDLRAPLRHVNGYMELLTKHNYHQLNDKGKHYITSIVEASTQMGVLIDDLLNFSRTGRMEMKLDTIDMNRALEDALAILEQEITGRAIEWHKTIQPNIYADYAMMRQVWVNLLGNAIKYTRKRTIAKIEIGVRSDTNEHVFFVRDNGAGFDMKYSQKLFGVFQRLHSSDEFEGTGIGLANVHQVIKRHNGRVWAEAEINNGATFYFSIPKI
jgi:PAS domain S-box-containing protein